MALGRCEGLLIEGRVARSCESPAAYRHPHGDLHEARKIGRLYIVVDSDVSGFLERPGEFPSEGPGISPESADRGVRYFTSLELADRSAVDTSSLGHVGQTQPLAFSFGSERGHCLNKLAINHWRKILAIGFDVPGELFLIRARVSLGASGFGSGSLLRGQIGISESPSGAFIRVR
jgi:hypothetical protein